MIYDRAPRKSLASVAVTTTIDLHHGDGYRPKPDLRLGRSSAGDALKPEVAENAISSIPRTLFFVPLMRRRNYDDTDQSQYPQKSVGRKEGRRLPPRGGSS